MITFLKTKKLSLTAIASLALLTAFSCKPSELEEYSSLQSGDALAATHNLDITFTPSTGIVSYEVKTLDGSMSMTPTFVRVAQNISTPFRLPSLASPTIITGESPGGVQYDLELTLESGQKCKSVDPIYLSIKNAPISCEGGAPASDSTSVEVSESSSEYPSAADPFKDAAECSGAEREDYLICRFFDGGKQGCFNKFSCIARMTSAECESEIARMNTNDLINHHRTNWDCSAE